MKKETWHIFDSINDAGPASQGAIGMIVLDSDIVIEQEVRAFLPREPVGLYATRINIAPSLTPESLRALEHAIPEAVGKLIPNDRLDVIAFGCTSAAMALGSRHLESVIRKIRPEVAVTNPIQAAIHALNRLPVSKLAVLTPYEAQINHIFDDFWAKEGAQPIVARGCFNKDSDPTISRVSPQDIYRAGERLVRESGADGLFISCTALRCSSVIERLESALGVSVVTSNQALAWHALRLAGYTRGISSFGKLFTLN